MSRNLVDFFLKNQIWFLLMKESLMKFVIRFKVAIWIIGIVAFIGAVILVWIVRLIKGKSWLIQKGRSGIRNGLIKLNQQLTYENDLLKSAGKRRYTFGTFIFFRGLKPFYQITTFNLTALGTREKLFYRDFSALNLSFFFFSNIQLQDTIGIFRFNFSLVGYFR